MSVTGSTDASSGGEGSSSTGPIPVPQCATKSELPDDAPELPLGEWVFLGPHEPEYGTDLNFTQGMTIDPCNPANLYTTMVGFTESVRENNGIYRSTNAGASWDKVGHLDFPIRVRVDPEDPLHIYACDAVSGSQMGFWISDDGGENFAMPGGFSEWASEFGTYDVYHLEPDPTDFDHVLLGFHSGWADGTSGVLETLDGGDSWIEHPVIATGAGSDVFFLFEPSLGIGSPDTWLFSTQDNGYWRTTDAGESWSQVSEVNMQHGGASIYYAPNGILYASSAQYILRSDDNGASFTHLDPETPGYLTVTGDGEYLYTGRHGGSPVWRAPLDDDQTWSEFGPTPEVFYVSSPFEMVTDHDNHILYMAHTGQGVWARKLQ